MYRARADRTAGVGGADHKVVPVPNDYAAKILPRSTMQGVCILEQVAAASDRWLDREIQVPPNNLELRRNQLPRRDRLRTRRENRHRRKKGNHDSTEPVTAGLSEVSAFSVRFQMQFHGASIPRRRRHRSLPKNSRK